MINNVVGDLTREGTKAGFNTGGDLVDAGIGAATGPVKGVQEADIEVCDIPMVGRACGAVDVLVHGADAGTSSTAPGETTIPAVAGVVFVAPAQAQIPDEWYVQSQRYGVRADLACSGELIGIPKTTDLNTLAAQVASNISNPSGLQFTDGVPAQDYVGGLLVADITVGKAGVLERATLGISENSVAMRSCVVTAVTPL
jgi:hypothetical protein